MNRKNSKEYKTHAPQEKEMTINTDGRIPNQKNYPGDSVDQHESMETANALIGKGEIGQQNENL